MNTTVATKTVCIVRFDFAPRPDVSDALVPHIVGQGTIFTPPGVVVSIFNTNSTVSEIDQSMSVCENVAYMLFEVTNDTCKVNIPGDIGSYIGDFVRQQASQPSSQPTIEQLRASLQQSIDDQDFERAAILRDQINNFQ